jgi:hypothetical protein
MSRKKANDPRRVWICEGRERNDFEQFLEKQPRRRESEWLVLTVCPLLVSPVIEMAGFRGCEKRRLLEIRRRHEG